MTEVYSTAPAGHRILGVMEAAMEIALVQYDIAWEDKPANHDRIEAMLEEAEVPPGAFVLLPELGDTGFSMDIEAVTARDSIEWALELSARRGWTLQIGHAERHADGLGRNCATIVRPDGVVSASYRKIFPMTILGEHRCYGSGEELVLADIGPAVVAPLICYDLRFPELWRIAALEGATVFAIGASWPAERVAHWRHLLVSRAMECQAWVLGCNRVGQDPNLSYSGSSMVVAPDGTVVAEAGSEAMVLRASLDFESSRQFRERFPVLKDARRELLGALKIIRS
jgi:predicted amidohydrolase